MPVDYGSQILRLVRWYSSFPPVMRRSDQRKDEMCRLLVTPTSQLKCKSDKVEDCRLKVSIMNTLV